MRLETMTTPEEGSEREPKAPMVADGISSEITDEVIFVQERPVKKRKLGTIDLTMEPDGEDIISTDGSRHSQTPASVKPNRIGTHRLKRAHRRNETKSPTNPVADTPSS